MIRLNRHHVFLLAVSLIFLYYFLLKFQFILKSEKVVGRNVGYESVSMGRSYKQLSKIIYEAGGKTYVLYGPDNYLYEEEWLNVLYEKENPGKAYVYNFMGFWYSGMLFCGFFIFLAAAAVYGFMEKKTRIKLNFKKTVE